MPSQEVLKMPEDDNGETVCEYCGRVYNQWLGDRFWSGSWTVTADDGTSVTYNILCDGCHRDLVRSS